MSNDMRIVKFKMMIRDIFEDLGKNALTDNLGETVWNEGYGAVWLAVIYDYDKLNSYGKIIMEQVSEMDEDEMDEDTFWHQTEFVENCEDIEYRMKAAKALVEKLDEEERNSMSLIGEFRKCSKIYFLFWSLMILAVDDADKTEHLSLICDFAKMLKISDTEMMDIVQIIRAIYHIEETYSIQTNACDVIFRALWKKYGVNGFNEKERMKAMFKGMQK